MSAHTLSTLFDAHSTETFQDPAGPPDESVDELFKSTKDQDDNTLAEYKSRQVPQWKPSLTLDRLLKRPRFSDCIIKCQSRTYRCHRAILASRCDFFLNIFSGSFQVSKPSNNNIAPLIEIRKRPAKL